MDLDIELISTELYVKGSENYYKAIDGIIPAHYKLKTVDCYLQFCSYDDFQHLA